MDNKKLATFLGFALKARLCTKGGDAVLTEIRGKKADVVLLDSTAAGNTKKMIENACTTHQIRCIAIDGAILQQLCNSNCKVISIKKSGLSEQIKQLGGTYIND